MINVILKCADPENLDYYYSADRPTRNNSLECPYNKKLLPLSNWICQERSITFPWNEKILTLFFSMFSFDPPENIRKPKIFWCFQGGSEGKIGKKMVNLCVRLKFQNLSYFMESNLEILKMCKFGLSRIFLKKLFLV